jgi:hypothetical protein
VFDRVSLDGNVLSRYLVVGFWIQGRPSFSRLDSIGAAATKRLGLLIHQLISVLF